MLIQNQALWGHFVCVCQLLQAFLGPGGFTMAPQQSGAGASGSVTPWGGKGCSDGQAHTGDSEGFLHPDTHISPNLCGRLQGDGCLET